MPRTSWSPLLSIVLLLVAADCNFAQEAVSQETELSPSRAAADSTSQAKPGAANRLARETSPYLLLHAHNPVDWYPWGPEAFEKAKAENKLIFLSVGYSSCYWCHVMERKVFSDAEIAAYMNEHFVNVKVDREERPDVDDIYMTSLSVYFQLIGAPQAGGWPLSMFLTPQGEPVAGGTYFPPEDAEGQLGFPTVMRKMQTLWQDQEKSLRSNGETITAYVRQVMQPRVQLEPVELERATALVSVEALTESFDAEHGGVDYSPDNPDSAKFPVPAKLALLLYEARVHGDEQAERVVLKSLDHIASGGIRDHLGGGFHRYSTDRYWLVPHFEKMLYDNAQLADLFVAAYEHTGEPRYRRVAEDVFTYVLRDMRGEHGGFYSAQDAETDAVEGKYYVWSGDELDRVLGDEAELFRRVYGAGQEPPFEHGYVLHLPRSLEQAAQAEQVPPEELEKRLAALRAKLLAERQKREAPLLDDKVLTSWNGLMIGALANGGAAFERPDLTAAAEEAARFIMADMRDAEGRLLRTYRAETAKLNAYLDDYAFFIDGLLALHRATGDEKWLNSAKEICDQQIELFWDEARSGFFFTSHHHEELLARTKNAYDAVLPSGNSVSARNLVRLAQLTGNEDYRRKAEQVLKLFVPKLPETPGGMSHLALALEEYLDAAEAKTSATEGDAAQVAARSGAQVIRVQAFKPVQPPPAEGSEETPEKPKKPQRVKFQAHLSVDKLPPGKTCEVMFLIDIQPGWHINTNPARPDYLIPTQVGIESKLGVKLTGVKYPKGKVFKIPGAEEPQHAYEKRVAIRGTLTVPAEAAGKTDEIELQLRFQACNADVCLPPETARIAGKIPVAKSPAEVKKINEKLFAPPKEEGKDGEKPGRRPGPRP